MLQSVIEFMIFHFIPIIFFNTFYIFIVFAKHLTIYILWHLFLYDVREIWNKQRPIFIINPIVKHRAVHWNVWQPWYQLFHLYCCIRCQTNSVCLFGTFCCRPSNLAQYAFGWDVVPETVLVSLVHLMFIVNCFKWRR